MKGLLVKEIANVYLSGKTVVQTVVPNQESKTAQKPKHKAVSDPFFEVKSQRATDGDRVTVTFAHC